MTSTQLDKKYPQPKRYYSSISDTIENSIISHDFYACCGMDELSFDDGLRKLETYDEFESIKLTPEFVFDVLSFLLETINVAGFILTDVKKKFTKVNKILSKIVPPITCGQNPNSGNIIYMWVVSREALKNYKASLSQKIVITPKKNTKKK